MSFGRPGKRGGGNGGRRQGHSGRGREFGHDQEALRQDRPGVHESRPAAPTASCCSRPRAWPSPSAASSSMTRRCGRRPAAACRSRNSWPSSASLPGIKVDTGAKPLAGFPGETITEGLDGLRERLQEYLPARRALRQVARGHRHRRRHPERLCDPCQCARAGALCRACARNRTSCRSSSPRC